MYRYRESASISWAMLTLYQGPVYVQVQIQVQVQVQGVCQYILGKTNTLLGSSVFKGTNTGTGTGTGSPPVSSGQG